MLGPIPWESINTFAHRNDFASDDIEYETFVYLIQNMDSAFLEHQQETSERENKPRGKTGDFRPPNTGAGNFSAPKRR